MYELQTAMYIGAWPLFCSVVVKVQVQHPFSQASIVYADQQKMLRKKDTKLVPVWGN